MALRVNPDIDARSHPYISTGLKQNKFGVDIGRAREIFEKARAPPGVRMTGVQAHIGSQILDAEPLAETARELSALARELAGAGFPIETVDVGGGIGIGTGALTPETYAAACCRRSRSPGPHPRRAGARDRRTRGRARHTRPRRQGGAREDLRRRRRRR